MAKFKKGKELKNWKSPKIQADEGKLRIVGGQFRGWQIRYSGDPVTRPMKDDIREAVFNLVGGWTPGKAVFDLFAGTGAMGLEAMSRGATKAYLVERHFPTVKVIRENVELLDPSLAVEVVPSDSFFWSRKFLADTNAWPSMPWLVFCCPPYQLFIDQTESILTLISNFLDAAPNNSLFVVESDGRFDVSKLPYQEHWVARKYSPAVISIYKKFGIDEEE